MLNGTTITNGKKKNGAAHHVDAGAPNVQEAKIGDYRPKVFVMSVEISGISDLIVNNFEKKAREMLLAQEQGGTKKGRGPRKPKDVKQLFEDAKYKNTKGIDCFPARAIRNAMIDAARVVEGAPAMTVLKNAIFVVGPSGTADPMIPIEGGRCYMREDPVRNATGVADVRIRAAYAGWKMRFAVHVPQSVLTPTQVAQLLEHAGFAVGIGEWRPSGKTGKGGEFGRFTISDMG